MTKREAQELEMGLRSPFGRWLINHLKERGEEIIRSAAETIPDSYYATNERERNFGAGHAVSELVTSIPHTITDLVKRSKDE